MAFDFKKLLMASILIMGVGVILVIIQEILATLYQNLGLDPATTYLVDPSGRPQHLVQQPAIRELVG